ncbi:MAG: class I SAM-dependent methyltransferase [Saprospiraceae bacterium]|nr:class I SAM-dependent methyltransferase [Saprospiraceae bacterium]
MDFHQNDLSAEKIRGYIELRKKEQRLFPDEWVMHLPKLPRESIHHEEWKIREKSMQRLLNYLPANKNLEILDLGCGNGWLANVLAKNTNYNVLGIEINDEEFAQAKSLFTSNNCKFLQSDIFNENFELHQFDCIILNASIQYFPDPVQLIDRLLNLMSEGGSIHIIDTPIYKSKDVSAAKKRSREYFEKMGVPGMQYHYFHHSTEMLRPYDYDYLYFPGTKLRRFFQIFSGPDSPFPWIRISGRKSAKQNDA